MTLEGLIYVYETLKVFRTTDLENVNKEELMYFLGQTQLLLDRLLEITRL